MMLRMILLSLVTSMGLELPSGRDLSGWYESGRAWTNAKMADITGPEAPTVEMTEVVEVAESTEAATGEEADAAFLTAMGDTKCDFVADRAVPPATPMVDAPAPMIAGIDAPPAPLVDAIDESADEPMTVATGLPDGEEVATIVSSEPASEVASDLPADESASPSSDVETTRSDRLASAVRLTRQAAQAWAAVMSEPEADADTR